MNRSIFHGFLAVTWIAASTSAAARDDAAWREQVKQAWQARQESVPRFAIEWVEQKVSYMGIGVPRDGKGLVHDMKCRIVCDGAKMTFTRRGRSVHNQAAAEAGIEREYTCAFDGRECRELYIDDIIRHRAGGFIREGVFDERGSYERLPVVWQFRPLSAPHFGLNLDEWKTSDRRGSAHGVPCRVMERFNRNDATGARDGSVGKEYIWIAEQEGFPFVRYQCEIIDGVALADWMLDAPDPQARGFSTGWKRICRNGSEGNLDETVVVRGARIDFDPEIPEDAFTIRFPPGALLNNESSGYNAVVRADGTIRAIAPGETWMTIEQILETDPPNGTPVFPGESRMNWPRHWGWWLGGACALAVFGWWAWGTWREMRAQT